MGGRVIATDVKGAWHDLGGRVAIVTGAARGQGANHVQALASCGAAVLATDVLDDEGRAQVAAWQKVGLDVVWHHLDVTSAADWDRVVAAAVGRWKTVDVLVNNAGVTGSGNVVEVTREEWERVLGINLTGSLLGIQRVGPAMQATGGGSIINVSSVLGTLGTDTDVAYHVSKGALHMLTRAAAVTLAPSVRVNTLTPGIVATEMAQGLGADRLRERLAAYPMGRAAEVPEVTAAVLFLASDAASFVTGSELRVDGGALAGAKTTRAPGSTVAPVTAEEA